MSEAETEAPQSNDSLRESVARAVRDWDDLEKFLDTFEEIRYRPTGGAVDAASVLVALAQEHGKDVIGRMGEVAKKSQDEQRFSHPFWTLNISFCQALPRLGFDTESLADAMESVLLAEGSDLAGGGIYRAIEELSRRSLETSDLLFNTFVARSDSPVASLASSALLGLAHFDLREAHRRALALTQAEATLLRRTGLGTLSSFSYSEAAADLLQATLGKFDEMRARPNPDTDYVLARAYGILSAQNEKAAEAFVEMAGRDDPGVQAQVAFILFRHADTSSHHPWYRKALLSLASMTTSQTHSLWELDHCVSKYASGEPGFTCEFLEAFVGSRNYGREGEEAKIANIFGQTVGSLRREALDTLEAMITHWFASSDRRLNKAAWDLVGHGHYGSFESNAPLIKLSKSALDSLNDKEFGILLDHVLGYAVGGRPLAALIVSALRREPLTPSVADLIEEILSEHVLYNYPGSAESYLKAESESGDLNEVQKGVVQKALANSRAYFKALADLPRLKEFRPPSHRIARLRLAHNKRQRAIMEAARKKSVIMSLVQNIPLKFGSSFFTEMEGGFTEPTTMGTVSGSFELPRGEVIDPLGQQFMRIKCISSGLQDAQEEETEES